MTALAPGLVEPNPMPIAEDQIRRAVETVWATMLGLAIEPRPYSIILETLPGLLTGCVEITGAWQGAVTLDCAPRLAVQAAAILFAIEPGDTSPEHVADALGELTNIVGGQVKALLPEPCRLSLPAVAPRADAPFRALNDPVLARLDFACQDFAVRVTILKGSR